MDPRKDSYVPIYYAGCRYDKPILLKGSMNGITVTGLEHGNLDISLTVDLILII